jgi:hypothetical protein
MKGVTFKLAKATKVVRKRVKKSDSKKKPVKKTVTKTVTKKTPKKETDVSKVCPTCGRKG